MAKKDKDSLYKLMKNFALAVKNIYHDVNNISNTWAKVDQAAANFAKSMGGAAETMRQLRQSTIDLVAANKLAINYGVNAEKLIELQQQYIQQIGRRVQSNNVGLESFAAMSKVLQDQGAVDMIAKLENFGVSMTETGNRVGKMFADASKKGISFETYSKNFLNNIEVAQNYTFEKGLKGLQDMARKASEIKLDIQQAASFANKVNTVEGAINVGAKLQVLGGTFSQFADPLGMLNESLNDMDALQDRMIKMMGNLGRFNRETGEIEVSAFNKQRIRIASEAMGVGYSEMMKMINSKARRNEIEEQLSSNTSISDDVRNMVLNMGTIENGKAGINIDGKFVEVSKITNDYQEQLIRQNQTQGEDIKEIVKTLRGWDDMRKGRIEQYKNAEAQSIGSGLGRLTKTIDETLGGLGSLLMGAATLFGVGKLGSGAWKAISTLRREDGGLLYGPSHAKGGMRISGTNMEVEGGEFVVNKKATQKNLGLLQAINRDKYEDGGILGSGGENNSVVDDILMAEMIKKYFLERNGGGFKSSYNGKIDPRVWSRYSRIYGKTSALKAGSKALGKVAGPLAAIMGIMSTADTDAKVRNGEIERGSREHSNASRSDMISLYSGIGATIGSFLPGFGTLIGTGVGALVGWAHSAIKNDINRKAKLIKDSLRVSGFDLKGDYKKYELELIRNAFKNDRKISYAEYMSFDKKLQEKLVNNKDYILPNGASRYKRRNGGLLYGPSHENGGMPIVGSNMEVEGGEFIVNKDATRKNIGILNKINNDGIRPRITPDQNPLSVKPLNNLPNVSPSPQVMEMKPINLNISGTIRLETNNGQSVDITKEILKNQSFINSLTNMIEKQMVINEKGGNVITKGLR